MNRQIPPGGYPNGRNSNDSEVPMRKPVPREAGRVGRFAQDETTMPQNVTDDEDMRHLIPLLSRTSLESDGGSNERAAAAIAAGTAARRHAPPTQQNTNQQVDPRRIPPRDASLPQQSQRPDADKNFSRHIRNSPSVDKPLPRAPTELGQSRQYEDQQRAPPPPPHDPQPQGYERRPDEHGVDLRNTTDTTYKTQVAPAIVQETIRQDIHEIVQQKIFRETHEHHYVHRIQPVVEQEVLPARHFVKTSTGELKEVSAADLPGRSTFQDDHMQQRSPGTSAKTADGSMSAAAARDLPRPPVRSEPHTTSVISDGRGGTQSSTIYPPELQQGGSESGQTRAFYLNSPDKKDDGWRNEI